VGNSPWPKVGAIVAVAVVLFILSGVFSDSHGFWGVVGGIGWFGWMICVLGLIIWGIVALVRRRRTGREPAIG
jgi:uncharacterized membrane protein